MTTGDLLLQLEKELNEAGISDARFELLEIFSYVLGIEPSAVRLARDVSVSAENEASIRAFVSRFSGGEPLAYITGRAFFWNEEYKVGPGVLIPRPDTETLVEKALSVICGREPVIYDLCTGSGCIGISLYNALKARGQSPKMILVDKYNEALSYAQDNLSQACDRSDISVLKADILDPSFSFEIAPDYIVSNPPYITAADMAQLDASVKDHEPETALYGLREDGLVFYEKLASLASSCLNPGGMILVEHGYDQALAVQRIFTDSGLRDAASVKDLGGNDRVTFASKV